MLVGVDGGALHDVLEDLVLDVVRVVGGDGNRRHVSLSLSQSKHRLLSHRSPSFVQLLGFVLVSFLAPDKLLIRLDDAREESVLISTGFLDSLKHVPGRLLWPVQFLRQLQRADALSRDADLVHHPNPFDHGNPRGLHDRADSARKLLVAVPASIVELSGFVVVGVDASAVRAESSGWPPAFFEESNRVLFGPDPAEELQLPHRGLVGHCMSLCQKHMQ